MNPHPLHPLTLHPSPSPRTQLIGAGRCAECVLEEVVRCSACDVRLSSPRCGVELEEGVLEVLIDLHDRSLVTAAIAIVRYTHTPHTTHQQASVHHREGREEEVECGGLGVSDVSVVRALKMVTTFFSWHQLYPSMTSWWALATSVSPLLWLNCSLMSCPKV